MKRHLLPFFLLCAGTTPALAAGQLDPAFGNNGVAIHDLTANGTDYFHAGLIDAQGRYVGVGRDRATSAPNWTGAVVRVLRSGALDPQFGSGGVVRLRPSPAGNAIRWEDVIEQPDGKLIVAGMGATSFVGGNPGRAYVCRLLSNGSLDVDFAENGCLQPIFDPAATRETFHSLALRPDGRVVALAETYTPPVVRQVVMRLSTAGFPDPCFGDNACLNGGVVIQPETLPSFAPANLALTSGGAILIAGHSPVNNGSQFAVVRLNANGSLDTAWADGGHRLVSFNQGGLQGDRATTMAMRSDGSMVLAGTVATSSGTVLGGLAALDAFGTPIFSFGAAGKRMVHFNDVALQHLPTAIVEQGDGKLLVLGNTLEGLPSYDCGVMRLSADGTDDTTFGIDGRTMLDGGFFQSPQLDDGCQDMAVEDHSILLFGWRQSAAESTRRNTMMMRLDKDGVFSDGFEAAN